MTVHIFVGPTISLKDAVVELDAVYLPPASQGDVYRATLKKPQAIGIIDGYFERMPSIWHKEILWAMAEGIHVYGSASIGALRAAELAPFGMEGVGQIFKAYSNGLLEDDDEVAIVHGPADSGYMAMSEALINIRYTLSAAEYAHIISSDTCAAMVQIGKNLFYPERCYSLIIERAAYQGLSSKELDALRKWLPCGQVNQKREDALTMLRVMRKRLESGLDPKTVQYYFEYTDAWDYASGSAGELYLDSDTCGDTVLVDTLLDELRIKGYAYRHARQGAMLRFFAREEARRQGMIVSAETLQETAETFRRERGLVESKDLQNWLKQNDLDNKQFIKLMEEESKLRWIETLGEPEVTNHLLDYLRVSNEYPSLLARARHKQRTLEVYGSDDLDLMDPVLKKDGLLRWYFEHRLGSAVPEDTAYFARLAGFEDEDMLRCAILHEYKYSLLMEEKMTPEFVSRQAVATATVANKEESIDSPNET